MNLWDSLLESALDFSGGVEEKTFPCTQCGACCRRAHMVLTGIVPLRPDGSCAHLQADNSCGIYHVRPLECRIKEFGEMNGLDQKTNFELNAKACNVLQEIDKMPEIFRVKV